MDPVSFTASLVTVGGVTMKSSKLIYTLCERVKNAPNDVGNLLEQLQTFQELLEELQKQLQDSRDNTAAQSKLSEIWGKSIAHMQSDVDSLHEKLSKLEQLLKKKSLGSKVLLSARQMLSEKKVAEYQRKIDTHCDVLTCIKATVCDQKLSKLTQDTIQLGNDNRAGFQMISSEVLQATGHLGAEARAGFSNVSSDLKSAKLARDDMHQDLQSRMDDNAQSVDETRREQMRSIEINEAGFQAVQSALVTAVSFNQEGHESTHAMLKQQETMMQRLGNQLALEHSKNCVRAPRTRSDKWGSATRKTTVYWKALRHSLPIGKLCISVKQTRQCKGSENSSSLENTESSISVTFVPPKWLTCLAVEYRMKLSYKSIGDQWHCGANLRPLTVNQNPFVIDALERFDLGAIQKSFREGLIHPTDYVLDRDMDLHPWYLRQAVIESTTDCYKVASLLVYMTENGLQGQDWVFHHLAVSLRFWYPTTIIHDILQNHLRVYLQHGGNLFTQGDLREKSLVILLSRFELGITNFIAEFLFQSSDFWTVDELSSIGICFLGIVAQMDPGFRTRLKEYLAIYRSPLLAAGTIDADSLFESTLGIASVLRHFHGLREYESRIFLVGLCKIGTPSMLRPFIDARINLNDNSFHNMLGHAAAMGNLDTVCMLIESGANGALALYEFIRLGEKLSDGLFKHLLELLVENSRPTSYDDALLQILKSSRALLTHPKAPEILIRRKVFSEELIQRSCKPYQCNYMCMAIRKRLGSVVELLLQHEAYASTTSAWLMFSVMCGAAPCAEALIQHGADVNFLDGAGKSALQLAGSNVTTPHPRIFTQFVGYHHEIRCKVTAEEDAETLAVIERAFDLKAQSTDNLTVHEPSCELEPHCLSEKGEAVSAPQNVFEKGFGSLLTYYRAPLLGRHSRYHNYAIGDLWSLSFYEALLMRFFYVFSYVLLLALEIFAFIRGDKRVRMPSRSILSGVALLLLAFIWGSSPQTDLLSKLDAGRSFSKQDS